MSMRDWPPHRRPREKLLAWGPQALSDVEVLALVLGSGVRGASALTIAASLIEEHHDLRGVLDTAHERSIRGAGIGQAKGVLLEAVAELAQRLFDGDVSRGVALKGPQDTSRFLRARLRSKHYERFGCVFLDTRQRVLGFEIIAKGTIDGAVVHPREVVRLAIKHAAHALILAHNHPSGGTVPSAADRAITRRLTKALALIDVRVLDHIIVADTTCVSFADLGLL
ncbi:MAG: DNA repair protein RadC [Gammaproteobacteria bacterium]|nr:DNA repair protein RadC [Gammaproteobacteria bacterium]